MANNFDRVQGNIQRLIEADAPESDVLSYLKSEGFTFDRYVTAAARRQTAGDYRVEPGAGRQLMQGLTMGGADEIEAGVRSALPGAPSYERVLAAIRGANEDYQRTDPFKAGAAQIAGAAIPAVAAALATAPAGGAGGAAPIGSTLLRLGLTGAAEGAGAGFLSSEGGLGPRVMGGVEGGAYGAALAPLPTLGARAFGAGKAVAAPFLEGGRQDIVGEVLRRFTTDPPRAIANLESASLNVPGSLPTTAQAARDPGLAALETPVASALDDQALLAARKSAQNEARVSQLDRIAGDEGAIEQAKTARDVLTAPLREQAFAAGDIDPKAFSSAITLIAENRAREILASSKGKRQDVETAMNWAKGRLAKASSVEDLYEVRKDLRDAAIGAKYSQDVPSLRLAKGELEDLIRTVDDVIEGGAPGFQKYLARYSELSRPIDQMKALQELRRTSQLAAPDVATGLPILSQAKMKQGLQSQKEALKKLSPYQWSRVNAIMRDLDRAAAAASPSTRPPGSNTVKNLSVAATIGRLFGEGLRDAPAAQTVGRTLGWLYKMPEEHVRTLMVDAMLDPKLAAMLLAKADKTMAPAAGRALARRAYDRGLMSIGNLIAIETGIASSQME